MKVERKGNTKFVPIVLTLESQGEVDLLLSLIGNTHMEEASKLFNVDVLDVFTGLQSYSIEGKTTKNPIRFLK